MGKKLQKKSYLQDNYQDAYLINVYLDTLALTLNGYSNQDGGRSLENLQYIKVSGSRRVNRPLARRLRLFKGTSDTTEVSQRVLFWLPWLNPTGFDTFMPGVRGTYQGVTVEMVSKQDEKLV